MKRRLAWLAVLLACIGAGVIGAAWRGWIALPFVATHAEITAQLRDRGTVAIAGGVPFGLSHDETPLADVSHWPTLAQQLAGRDGRAASRALRESRADGLLVRTDRALGAAGSVLHRLSTLRAVPGFTAVYSDDTAALYEAREGPSVDERDAASVVEVVRLVMQGAAPPPDRLFPESVRRAQPTEVAVIIRDGASPILWRAVRGGSLSRALVDATYAALDRWNTRQQQQYGPLREAILRLPLTIAVFYDRSTLGARSREFLTRAVDPTVFSIGFEHLGRWEYVLPPGPNGSIGNPVDAIANLARERDVQPPGYLRPELTLYRFRALQLVEQSAQGPVLVFDPIGR